MNTPGSSSPLSSNLMILLRWQKNHPMPAGITDGSQDDFIFEFSHYK